MMRRRPQRDIRGGHAKQYGNIPPSRPGNVSQLYRSGTPHRTPNDTISVASAPGRSLLDPDQLAVMVQLLEVVRLLKASDTQLDDAGLA